MILQLPWMCICIRRHYRLYHHQHHRRRRRLLNDGNYYEMRLSHLWQPQLHVLLLQEQQWQQQQQQRKESYRWICCCANIRNANDGRIVHILSGAQQYNILRRGGGTERQE